MVIHSALMTPHAGSGSRPGHADEALEFLFRWFGPHDPVQLTHMAQVPNVRTVVTALADFAPGEVWTPEAIQERTELCAANGLQWTVVESIPLHESIKLGSPDRDRHIEAWQETLVNLAAAGIHTVCYNFMPVFDWMRTDFEFRLPDGSTSAAYVQKDFEAVDLSQGMPQLPAWPRGYTAQELRAMIARYEGVTSEVMLERFSYFINQVAPVAEQAGLRLGVHPDDPPWPILGLPRIVTDEAALAAVLSCTDNPAHGLTFCTGSLGARADNDLPAMARRFGSRTHFVHARNVRRTGERDFHEVSHHPSDGDVDLPAVIRALLESGFSGPIRPDHGRHIWGEQAIVGYGLHDRALGLMYLQGIHDSIRAGGQP